MDYGLLNLGSLLLGLAGWAVPLVWLGRMSKGKTRSAGPGAVLSLGCCGAALWMQLWYGCHLTDIQDWSAILDTWPAVNKVGLFLLVTTLLLNLLPVWMERALAREEQKGA